MQIIVMLFISLPSLNRRVASFGYRVIEDNTVFVGLSADDGRHDLKLDYLHGHSVIMLIVEMSDGKILEIRITSTYYSCYIIDRHPESLELSIIVQLSNDLNC